MVFVSVAIDLALDRLFTYSVPAECTEKLRVGQLLRVSFSRREVRGFALRVWTETEEAAAAAAAGRSYAIKPILGIADEAPFFSAAVLQLVKWIAAYTCSPIETCLKAAVPAAVLKPNARPRELLFVEPALSPERVALTKRQQELYDNVARVGGGWMQQLCREFKTTPASLRALAEKGCVTVAVRAKRRDPLAGRAVMSTVPLELNALQRAALETISVADRPVLLHGVTGSGKTEIYLQAIARELEQGRGAIVLVPEIALTPQTVRRFAGRFGDRVAVLHSALSDGERYDEWHRIRTGRARVVVGPRSAVFAPVENLGLVVVDEEHDGSYKQDETPRYNARDVAVMRGRFERCKVVLGSATPSLESWLNAKKGKYALASVPERVAGRSLPEVHLLDLAEETAAYGHVPIFSKFLLDAIAERLKRGEQTILFLNRRGYARVCECKECGHAIACPDCSTSYTYHQADDCLRCHVCGGWTRVPARCPACGAREFSFVGIGTQRAEAALLKCMPHARVLRMDADSTSRKHSHDDILSQFRARKADVLLGTQMIAKGLDFPNVTLVGVLNADASLNMPDFRASERTYQLLAQVSGRAGRAEKPGEVFIQTSQPDAPAVAAAARSDYAGFADAELAGREEDFLPPYSKLALAHFKSQSDEQARGWCALYAAALEKWPGLSVGEPMPSPLERAEGWFRHQLLLRAPKMATIAEAWKWIVAERPAPSGLRVALDVDAISFT